MSRKSDSKPTPAADGSMWYVEIVQRGTAVVCHSMGPMRLRTARKTQRGASINLNHDDFYIRLVEVTETG